MYIEGGTSGVKVDVKDDGTYRQKAQALGELGEQARLTASLAFSNGWKITNNATAATVTLFHVKNNDTAHNLVIDRIYISSMSTGTVYVTSDQTYSSNGTSVTTLNNLNRNNTGQPDITAYTKKDSTLMTVAGTAVNLRIDRYCAYDTLPIDFKDALIVGYNKNLSLRFKGAGSEVFGLTVSGYMEEV